MIAGATIYEEGAWTPALNFGGATTGITYTTQTGTYTRNGDVYTAEANVVLSSKGSATGSATVTGLPSAPNLNIGGVMDFAVNAAG